MWGSLVGILVTPFPAYCQGKDPSCSSSFRNLVFLTTHRFSHHEIGITQCIFPLGMFRKFPYTSWS